jgi:poly(hydroxyalkanoate) depolymerase family esterase
MKNIILLFVLSFGILGFSQKSLEKIDKFGVNPGNLSMFVHIPKTSTKKLKPLVVVLHGCTQTANNVAQLTGWDKIADSNDFVVMYPQQKSINNPQLCFNWFRLEDQSKGSGECESIYEMIRYSFDHLNVHPDSVYVTGLSAGAGMTMIMLATHPETFQAGASFAGPPFQLAKGTADLAKVVASKESPITDTLVNRVLDQNPEYKFEYPKLYVFQGTADKVVKPYNAKMIVAQWIGVHNAEKVVNDPPLLLHQEAQLTLYNFKNKANEIVVVYIEAEGLSHALLIDPGKDKNHGGKKGLFGVDRNWHSTVYLAKEFGLMK